MARVLVACLGSGFAGDRGAGSTVHSFLAGSRLPGTVHVLDWREVPLGGDAGGRRKFSLRVTMEAARIRDPVRAPGRAFLVGIEGHGEDGHEGVLHAEAAGVLAGAARVALDLAHGLAGMEDTGSLDVERIARGDDAVTPPASASPTRLPAGARRGPRGRGASRRARRPGAAGRPDRP
jgi:hypothetical protein